MCALVSANPAGRDLADTLENGDFQRAIEFIEAGASAASQQPDGTTALMWAAYHARPEMVRALLDSGANPVAANRYGVQAVSIACRSGDLESVRLLVAAGADPNFTLPGGETLLMTASRSGNPGVVDFLIQRGADVNRRVSGQQTALMWAASEGHAEAVKILLRAGADPHAVTKNGFGSLHFAARAGHGTIARILTDAGVDVDVPLKWTGPGGFRSPRNNTSPLILAIENAHFELAVDLLELGADPSDIRTGYSPLHTMTWVRKAHLGDSADPEPPIHGKMSSTDFLNRLIAYGADLNQQVPHGKTEPGNVNERGSTPFFMAADRGDLEMMQLLVEHGADPRIPNVDGVTPLMVAAGLGRGPENDEAGTQDDAIAAVAYCLELGMDVNTVDANGETAMHGAAYGQWPRMVKFLYENGADIQTWNNLNAWQWSPLLIAQGYRRGNFKPSYETIDAIESVMAREGITLRYDPPAPKQGYED